MNVRDELLLRLAAHAGGLNHDEVMRKLRDAADRGQGRCYVAVPVTHLKEAKSYLSMLGLLTFDTHHAPFLSLCTPLDTMVPSVQVDTQWSYA